MVLLTLNSNMSGHGAIRTSAARLKEQLPDASFKFVAEQVIGAYALLIWTATGRRCDAVEGGQFRH